MKQTQLANRLLLIVRRFFRRTRGAVRAILAPILNRLASVPQRTYLLIASIALALLVLGYTASFFWPRAVWFSFSQPACFFNPVLLPGLLKQEPGKTYATVFGGVVMAGQLPLFASSICLVAVQPPRANTTDTTKLSLGNTTFKKTITVKSEALPRAISTIKPKQLVSTRASLSFKLDKSDLIFSYQLSANGQKAACAKKATLLTCEVAALQLAQSTTYELTLQRMFNTSAQTTLKQTITTVEALRVTDSSIKPGDKLLGVPTELAITFNKPLVSVDGAVLKHIGAGEVPTTNSVSGNTLIIKFNQPLPRSASLELAVPEAMSPDEAFLPAPYSLQFATSGGPKVAGISIGSSRVEPGNRFTITFDSAVSASQAIQNFIKINGGATSANFTVQGKTVIVAPSGLARCAAFNVSVLDGLQNEFGVQGGSAWKFNSRTACQVVFSIGASVRGRGITAYRFGSGPSRIVISGSIHGDEKSAAATLRSFIDDLEANADKIPAHRSIIIIPVVNPDGYASGSRTNANNIDLNRNFPASNWKPGVKMPDGTFLEQGGGASPLSEPESRALANFTLSQGPRLALSYHAVAPLVAANESGDSRALASTYGSKVGWRSYGNEADGNFNYDTTGSYEDWLHDKYGIPALLIEQATMTSNEYARQKSAMWAMVQLP